MKRIKSWKPVVDKFQSKLSFWKARTLSFAGRLVLIKAVLGSIPNYFLSLFKAPSGVLKTLEGIRRRFLWGGTNSGNKIKWVAWNNILKPKKCGGLGVGSIEDLNLGLLAKWWFRYKTSQDQLWCKVVNAIHGGRRRLGFVPYKKSSTGVWSNIAAIKKDFADKGLELKSKFSCKLGLGNTVRFWEDQWCGASRLKDCFPAVFLLGANREPKVIECYNRVNNTVWWKLPLDRLPFSHVEVKEANDLWLLIQKQKVTEVDDCWRWLSQGKEVEFSVKVAREDLSRAAWGSPSLTVFKWNNLATPKVYCFVWRAVNNWIPTAETLAYRAVHVSDGLCKKCGLELETAEHILVSCLWARTLWWSIGEWLKIQELKNGGSLNRLLGCTWNQNAVSKKTIKGGVCSCVAGMLETMVEEE